MPTLYCELSSALTVIVLGVCRITQTTTIRLVKYEWCYPKHKRQKREKKNKSIKVLFCGALLGALTSKVRSTGVSVTTMKRGSVTLCTNYHQPLPAALLVLLFGHAAKVQKTQRHTNIMEFGSIMLCFTMLSTRNLSF